LTRLADIGQQIRDDIAAGALPLGARITMEEMAARYGASHMPIREALRRLAGEGLVDMEPGRGARVRSVDRGFVTALFEARGALEAVLSRRAAARADASLLSRLGEIERLREACVAAGDYPAALRGNRLFHQTINAAADHPQAVAIVDQHWVLIAALWHRYGYGEARFAGVASDHRNLLRAFAAGEPDAAATITAAHVIKSKYDLLERMETGARPRAVA
jgi:DNA-binding GntR family transcriptional regulator